MLQRIISRVVIAAAVLAPMAAQAQLAGKTVQVEYLFPDASTVFNGNSVNVVVGPGVELAGFPVGDPRTNVDLSNSNILVTYNSLGTWTSTSFNGLHFFDVFSGIDAFTAVLINPATNMVGLDASRISFDADNIYVNWQGLSFDEHTVVSLDVNGMAAVPEPATVGLMATGLLGLGAVARRRRRTV